MLKRVSTLAIAMIALAAPVTSALAQSVTLSSNSNNGSLIAKGGGAATVDENSGSFAFDIFGATATRSGNNLAVTIYTNYANNIGELHTGLGFLFFGTGAAGAATTTYAASMNYDGTGGPAGVVYQPGTHIQNSFYGNTNNVSGSSPGNGSFTEPNGGVYPTTVGSNGVPCTTSACNGGSFNTGNPVGVTTGAPLLASTYGVTETWSVTAGTANGSHDQLATNFATDGKVTFTLNNVFATGVNGLNLGGASGLFSIEWAMTCSNDYVIDTFLIPPGGNQGSTPLPAALPLFASGAGFLGLLNWRRKRKKDTATVVAA
jgi:hypothetical protein